MRIPIEREEKFIKWLQAQHKKPSFPDWTKDVIKVVWNFSRCRKYGDRVNVLAGDLLLKYYARVTRLGLTNKYGKKRMFELAGEKLEEIDKHLKDTEFHMKHLFK